jgi:hypothetical protein
MRRLAVILVMCLLKPAQPQQWITTIDDGARGADAVSALAVDDSGCVYVTGEMERASSSSASTVKLSPTGEVRWQSEFDPCPGFRQKGGAVAVTGSGNVYVAVASKDSSSVWCNATVKYRPNGSEAWRARYSDTSHYLDIPEDLALFSNGRCVVTGYSGSNAAQYDYATVSYDSAGQLKWLSRYSGPGTGIDQAQAVATDSRGFSYVTGHSWQSGRDCAVTIKYDSLGNPVWVHKLALPDADFSGTDVAVDTAGYVYVTGYCAPVVASVMTMKLSPAGDTLWKRVFQHGGGMTVRVDGAGNVYVAGAQSNTPGTPDILALKYDPAGNLLWSSVYNGPSNGSDYPYGMDIAADGSMYIVGLSGDTTYGDECLIIKYNPGGDTAWTARLPGTSIYMNFLNAVEVDNRGDILVGGSLTTGKLAQQDYLIAKYPPTGPGVAENRALPVVPEPMLSASPTVVSRLCRLTVPAGEHQAIVSIADITGRTVRGIPVPSARTGDRVSVAWDTRDEHGRLVPNGVYFVRLLQAQAQPQAVCKVIVQR